MAEYFAAEGRKVHVNGNDSQGDVLIDGARADIKLINVPDSISGITRGAKQAPIAILDGTQIAFTHDQARAMIANFEIQRAKHPGKFTNLEQIWIVEGDRTLFIYHVQGAALRQGVDESMAPRE